MVLRTDQRGQDFEGQDQESATTILQAKPPNPAVGLFWEVECYWNAAMPTHLYTAHSFLAAMGETDCDRDHMACRALNIGS